ncbi:MAG: bifunctional proline dehydrogenase/L-glutamate gamma-semialdehyde dehydrogenase PutA [Legionellaceae bacterium]|nr:bifunctional proline dehydrogenase/L-glutamate gamma-semialdehyde dehydrogenase PutA [Legionellaceae bacterium]
MLVSTLLPTPTDLRAAIEAVYRADESVLVNKLMQQALIAPDILQKIQMRATDLMDKVRVGRKKNMGIDTFLSQYSLSSSEGIALMCLAEALLRVPDSETMDSLIKDKLAKANWESHRGQSESFFVNATTWALMLTGEALNTEKADSVLSMALKTLVNRGGDLVVRKAVEAAMRIMSRQFVMGRTMSEALKRARKQEAQGYRYSYDMLGEAALTQKDAERYEKAYHDAIVSIGECVSPEAALHQRPSISIKLSALHPRYQEAQRARVVQELPTKLLNLAVLAKQYGIGLTVDAEESERLELSLDVIEQVFTHSSLDGWNGFGMAVQSYQKRAFYVLDWVAALARKQRRRIPIRLVKGAYWDSEVKKAQMLGMPEYPVFTRKVFTDISFQACAKKILTMTDAIYPQFATHNAYSVAMILEIVGEYKDFEFQCLHGMGNDLYEHVVPRDALNIPCRIYAPVGSHEDLLPYLVRRLLENGANSSFVNRIVDDHAPISALVEDPIAKAGRLLPKINQNIPLPSGIFWPSRDNSKGVDLTDRRIVAELQTHYRDHPWLPPLAVPMVPGCSKEGAGQAVFSPFAPEQVVGYVKKANQEEVAMALRIGHEASISWGRTSVEVRVACLNRLADLYEAHAQTFYALVCLEAGKNWPDAIAELREAIDFCRYYASQAKKLLSNPLVLQGYTGEYNALSLHPRGLVVCISPWNFPLAIFTGQVVAALVTGNTVIAKPAAQTPLIAAKAVQLMREAGFPEDVIQLVPGKGQVVGASLLADVRVKAVIFTGSTQTAHQIQTALVARGEEIIPLIAETGGQNTMIVDSSALLEQVVVDVISSAFGSAGQRCSALRVVYIQEEIYTAFVTMLKGAMAELVVGDPCWLMTDVGPVISKDALSALQAHVDHMKEKYTILYQCELSENITQGYFMPPIAIEIDSLKALSGEVFGPVLHVVKYRSSDLDSILEEINESGYGLTMGIHSRINSKINYIRERIRVGNCYVNRNMTGAVVGVQPFGGEGLSGTGPKAGGPNYLQRLCVERTFTVDTTAAGGNASLMSLPD